jgi:hypothetical protein
MMKIKRFKKSQEFRVMLSTPTQILAPFSVYATASAIRQGLGDDYWTNAAVQKALDALEFQRSGSGTADQCASGIAGMWEGRNVQLDLSNRV